MKRLHCLFASYFDANKQQLYPIRYKAHIKTIKLYPKGYNEALSCFTALICMLDVYPQNLR